MKKNIIWIGNIILVLLLIIGCDIILIENKTGNLKVRSYSVNYTDPSTITGNVPINAILDITYPDNRKATVVTDDFGYYDFGDVEIGEYSIQPRYCSMDYKKTITVSKDSNTTGNILIPYAGLYYYAFKPNRAPVNSLTIRQALSKAISRQEIIDSIVSDNNPAYCTIPEVFDGDWSNSAHSMIESVSEANSLLSSTALVSVEILYNTNPIQHQYIANTIKSEWESLIGSGTTDVNVTLNGLAWAAFLEMRDVDKNFQIARHGWIFDSNNLLNFYKSIIYIDTIEYQDLLTKAQDDLDLLSMDDYEKDLIDINNYLIDNSMILPIYYYKQ